jgi:hypothetical protein
MYLHEIEFLKAGSRWGSKKFMLFMETKNLKNN